MNLTATEKGEMTDTTDRAPWCPMTGHPMVTRVTEPLYEFWKVGCAACGFGASQPFNNEAEADAHARRLIRAELARQALERELNSATLGCEMARKDTMDFYNWLGAHPLRLPGEGA